MESLKFFEIFVINGLPETLRFSKNGMLMTTKVVIGVFCGLALVTQISAQEVMIGRDSTQAPQADPNAIKEALAEFQPQKAIPVQPIKVAAPETKPDPAKPLTTGQIAAQKPAPPSVVKAPVAPTKTATDIPATAAQAPAPKTQPAPQIVSAPAEKPAVAKPAATAQIPAQKAATQTPTIEIGTAKVNPPVVAETKLPKPEAPRPAQSVAAAPAAAKPSVPEPRKPAAPAVASVQPNKPPTLNTVASVPTKLARDTDKLPDPPLNLRGATAFTRLANGFDFPIGRPDAQGYYKARGFQTRGHLGEDWDGTGGGDTDMGDPIYCIGDGVVVFARDCHQGWGNVIIIRHAYREGGSVRNIDSFYGHCQKILVKRGQSVARGQQIATIGNAHGLYDAHLHFEIRKNIAIGMSRNKFAKDYSNYCDPTQFIATHRQLKNTGGNWRIAMNTFIYDDKIKWDKLRNYKYARTGGGTSQSAKALKKTLAAQNVNARAN